MIDFFIFIPCIELDKDDVMADQIIQKVDFIDYGQNYKIEK